MHAVTYRPDGVSWQRLKSGFFLHLVYAYLSPENAFNLSVTLFYLPLTSCSCFQAQAHCSCICPLYERAVAGRESYKIGFKSGLKQLFHCPHGLIWPPVDPCLPYWVMPPVKKVEYISDRVGLQNKQFP